MAMATTDCQHTLAGPIAIEGIGLHSGLKVCCRLMPAAPNTGRRFVRVDLPGQPEIAATVTTAVPAQLSTLLQQDSAEVRTVEHALAALAGNSIDNCRIELDGPELPILDGSAQPWLAAIAEAGLSDQSAIAPMMRVDQAVTVWDGDAFVSAIPSPITRYTYGIDFERSPIGEQWYSWVESSATFARDIAPARTFTRQRDAERALEAGLIRGGSLDNAIVCSETDWLTPLRFDNEPVRHKLIDLLGDLSLIGMRWQGHFVAYKASHTLHGRLVRQLLATLAPAGS